MSKKVEIGEGSHPIYRNTGIGVRTSRTIYNPVPFRWVLVQLDSAVVSVCFWGHWGRVVHLGAPSFVFIMCNRHARSNRVLDLSIML